MRKIWTVLLAGVISAGVCLSGCSSGASTSEAAASDSPAADSSVSETAEEKPIPSGAGASVPEAASSGTAVSAKTGSSQAQKAEKPAASTQTSSAGSSAGKGAASSRTEASSGSVSSASRAKPSSSAPQPSSAVSTQKIAGPCSGDAGEVEQILFGMINEKRAELGLAELKWSDGYHTAAKIRADEIAAHQEKSGISHVRPDGSSWETVLKQAGLPAFPGGENLIFAENAALVYDVQQVAHAFYDGWINSPGHYANIISDQFADSGICVVYDGSDVYGVQMFGKHF